MTAAAVSPRAAPRIGARRRPHTRELLRAKELAPKPRIVRTEEIPALLSRLPSVVGTAQRVKTGKRGPGAWGPGTRPLTGTQRWLLNWLVCRIREHGGFYTSAEWEIAADAGCTRKTVNVAVGLFRERGLVESAPTKRKAGGTGPMAFRLSLALRRLLAGLPAYKAEPVALSTVSKEFSPIPDRVQPSTSEVASGGRGLEEGRASRADLLAALRAALQPRDAGLRSECLFLLRHVSLTVPPRWFGRALQLAEHAGSPAGSSIVAPGAWVRQELANTIRAAWEKVPPTWEPGPGRKGVRASTEAKLTAIREENGWPMKRPKPGAKPIGKGAPAPAAPPAPRSGSSLDTGDYFAAMRRLLSATGQENEA